MGLVKEMVQEREIKLSENFALLFHYSTYGWLGTAVAFFFFSLAAFV